MAWLPSGDRVLAFERGPRFIAMTNLSDAPVDLPAGSTILLASTAIGDGLLPVDTTVWLRPSPIDRAGGPA